MDFDVRPCVSAEEVKEAIAPIAYYFGRSAPDENLAERLTRVLPAQRVYAAWESGRAVGYRRYYLLPIWLRLGVIHRRDRFAA